MNTKQTTNWRKVRLGEILSVSGGGTPSTRNSEYWNGDIPWLTPAEVSQHSSRFIKETERSISKKGLESSSAKLMPIGSLLLTSRATIGDIVINEVPMATNQGFINIVPSDQVDQVFLYYWLKRNHDYFNQIAVGSTFPELIKSVFKQIPIDLPPIVGQKRIADILSAFDDKIELNNKVSRTLEEMARAIFKEWFVKFHFPGHEKNKFVDSELDKIPKGWKVKKIGEVASVVLGGTPSRTKPEYWAGNIPWINSGKVNEFRIISVNEYITKKGLDDSNARLMPKRTTVIAITGATLGQVSLLEIAASANQSVVGIFNSDILPPEFIYLYIKQRVNDLINAASGGAQQHINKQVVEEYPVLVPDTDTISEFANIVRPVFDQIANSIFENQKLATLRDLLLPRLMSGEIKV